MNKPIQFIQGRPFLKAALGWGFVLWLIGYTLGMMLFAIVPTNLIGWIITPIGTAIALWVAFKKLSGDKLSFYFAVAAVWTAIAVVFDYLFIVKAFAPPDGYYKFDVYLYYALTFLIPLAAGYAKTKKMSSDNAA